MSYQHTAKQPLDYHSCRYGASKLLFRGPRRQLRGDYIAVLGGSETYGKYMAAPYPALLETALGQPVVNLGYANAGADVFVNDISVMDICRNARACVIQITGAHNVSNRFYTVHPRRNDRFLRASSLLKTIYPEIDFTEFNFTRHLLATLQGVAPDKFALVRQELREAWIARMRAILGKIGPRVVLVWMSRQTPDAPGGDILRDDPLFVDRDMLDGLRPLVRDIVEIIATEDEIAAGHAGMIVPEHEVAIARDMLGTVAHDRLARELAEKLRA